MKFYDDEGLVVMILVDEVVNDDERDLVLLRPKDTGQVLGHGGFSEPPLKNKNKSDKSKILFRVFEAIFLPNSCQSCSMSRF